MAKQENIKVKEKDIVILRFDSSFPITEPDLHAMMKTIRDAVNKDQTIVNRFICLANGIDIETMNEEDFKAIWKAKWGEASFKEAERELAELENNASQLDLFDEETTAEDVVKNNVPGYNPEISSSDFVNLQPPPPPKHEDEVNSIEDVLNLKYDDNGQVINNEFNSNNIELNKPDGAGNTWKPLSEDELEKELKKIKDEEGDK